MRHSVQQNYTPHNTIKYSFTSCLDSIVEKEYKLATGQN